jgi:hypothetical protein
VRNTAGARLALLELCVCRMLDAIARFAPDSSLTEEERKRNSFGALLCAAGIALACDVRTTSMAYASAGRRRCARIRV